jgi:hypothetical protein
MLHVLAGEDPVAPVVPVAPSPPVATRMTTPSSVRLVVLPLAKIP